MCYVIKIGDEAKKVDLGKHGYILGVGAAVAFPSCDRLTAST